MAGIVCVVYWLIVCGDALVVGVGLGVVVVISGCGFVGFAGCGGRLSLVFKVETLVQGGLVLCFWLCCFGCWVCFWWVVVCVYWWLFCVTSGCAVSRFLWFCFLRVWFAVGFVDSVFWYFGLEISVCGLCWCLRLFLIVLRFPAFRL